MGLFDLDYDPITGKKYKTDAEKIRAALTPGKKRAIMEVVGNKCEMGGCNNSANDVHHIKPVAKGGTNVGSNLVVLCANCHRDADRDKITQTKMKGIVKNRSEKKKKAINSILRDRPKVGNEISRSSKKPQSPVDIPSFTPPTFDIPSFDSAFDLGPKKKSRKKKDQKK